MKLSRFDSKKNIRLDRDNGVLVLVTIATEKWRNVCDII
jgi:hypothetical protein